MGSPIRALLLASLLAPAPLFAQPVNPLRSDSPLYGGTSARNMVNLRDKNLPTFWDTKTKANIKWTANLGYRSYGGPVVAGGIVYVGTNAERPGNPDRGKAVVMAFAEDSGKFLWQNVHDIPNDNAFLDTRMFGQLATPTVDGNRLYYVTPHGEIICAEAKTGKNIWTFDMRARLKVSPFHCCIGSPLVHGGNLFLVTGNGANNNGVIPEPDAPSFLALDAASGQIAWQSNLPGKNIFEGSWSNPVLATINGQTQVIFPGGDAYLYSFEPDSGKLLWKCNCVPGQKKGDDVYAYFLATPVFYENKIYLGLGVYPDHPAPPRSTHVVCIDATKSGDVSPVNFDATDPRNAKSALVWAFGGKIFPPPKITERQVNFGPTMSTCAIHDGLLYISEFAGYLHCLDAKTGQRYWTHDLKSGVWASPYWVDGRIYMVTEDSVVFLFPHGKQKPVKPIEIEMEDYWTQTTPVAANGVLYLMGKSKLYAISGKK